MLDDETFAEYVAAPLRAPESVDATFTARVMTAVRSEAAIAGERYSPPPHTNGGRSGVGPRGWWRRPVTLRITPLAALALAATVAGIVLFGAAALHQATHRATLSSDRTLAVAPHVAPREMQHDTTYIVRFVLVAPSAASVALVGDFNNWNRNATRLTATASHGVWTASVALPPGRHEYAFIVDGARWTADPHAALTVMDDFGTTSSIVTVGAHGPTPTI